jgi:transaldolase
MPLATTRSTCAYGQWTSQLDEEYDVSLASDVDRAAIRLDTLWSVADETRKFVEQMILHPPPTEKELIEAAADYGAVDLFPRLSAEELENVAKEGQIPKHRTWGNRIMQGELAIDSLLTLAGHAHFAASQAELDERIRGQIM